MSLIRTSAIADQRGVLAGVDARSLFQPVPECRFRYPTGGRAAGAVTLLACAPAWSVVCQSPVLSEVQVQACVAESVPLPPTP